MVYILFVAGFFVLIYGAEWLVDGASKIAKKTGVSELIIGLTVVAFGTSLPELVVNLFAGGEGADSLAVGNVLGSNITNTLLVLGVAALISPLAIHRATVWREVLFGVFTACMLALLVADNIFFSSGEFVGLSQVDGLVLISYFIIFLYYTFGRTFAAGGAKEHSLKEQRIAKKVHSFKAFAQVAAGSLGLFFGGKWIVEGAIQIAQTMGVSDALIGMTIVAIGTSLPELAASVAAVRKNKVDIAIGNVVGSNLFNILWVLGLGSAITPLAFGPEQIFDTWIVVAVSVLLFFSLVLGRFKLQISRQEGFMFLVFYVLYLSFVILRGFSFI